MFEREESGGEVKDSEKRRERRWMKRKWWKRRVSDGEVEELGGREEEEEEEEEKRRMKSRGVGNVKRRQERDTSGSRQIRTITNTKSWGQVLCTLYFY